MNMNSQDIEDEGLEQLDDSQQMEEGAVYLVGKFGWKKVHIWLHTLTIRFSVVSNLFGGKFLDFIFLLFTQVPIIQFQLHHLCIFKRLPSISKKETFGIFRPLE